jgi:hypothetical protein
MNTLMNYLFAVGMIVAGLAFGALALVEWAGGKQ